MGGQVSAVPLFSRVSSDGGVVRQARSPRCFAERESIVLFFPPPVLLLLPPFLTSFTSTVFLQNVKTREVGALNPSTILGELITTARAAGIARKACLHAAALDAYSAIRGNVFIS